jgi:hypothetical protein
MALNYSPVILAQCIIFYACYVKDGLAGHFTSGQAVSQAGTLVKPNAVRKQWEM